MSDIYYNPEAYDLSVVGTADLGEMYEWCLFVVWEHLESGKYYYAHGSGCSCDSLGDYIHSLDDLDEATPHQLHIELDKWADGVQYRDDGEVAELHAKIAAL